MKARINYGGSSEPSESQKKTSKQALSALMFAGMLSAMTGGGSYCQELGRGMGEDPMDCSTCKFRTNSNAEECNTCGPEFKNWISEY